MSASDRAAACLVLAVTLVGPATSQAQAVGAGDGARRIWVGIGGGFDYTFAGSRYRDTRPGGFADGGIRFDVTARWQVGAGGAWGTFAATVPQFSVFEPFDHDPWLEHTLLFLESRYMLQPGARLRPYLGGRLGRMSELAEHTGATIRRAGAAAVVLAGASWSILPGVALDVSGNLGIARFGAARFERLPGVAPPSNAVRLAARLGLDIGIRR